MNILLHQKKRLKAWEHFPSISSHLFLLAGQQIAKHFCTFEKMRVHLLLLSINPFPSIYQGFDRSGSRWGPRHPFSLRLVSAEPLRFWGLTTTTSSIRCKIDAHFFYPSFIMLCDKAIIAKKNVSLTSWVYQFDRVRLVTRGIIYRNRWLMRLNRLKRNSRSDQREEI